MMATPVLYRVSNRIVFIHRLQHTAQHSKQWNIVRLPHSPNYRRWATPSHYTSNPYTAQLVYRQLRYYKKECVVRLCGIIYVLLFLYIISHIMCTTRTHLTRDAAKKNLLFYRQFRCPPQRRQHAFWVCVIDFDRCARVMIRERRPFSKCGSANLARQD